MSGEDQCQFHGDLGNWIQWGEYPTRLVDAESRGEYPIRPTDVGSWNLSVHKYGNVIGVICRIVDIRFNDLDSNAPGTCPSDLIMVNFNEYQMVWEAYPLRRVLLYSRHRTLQEQKSKRKESVDGRIYLQKIWPATRLNILHVCGRYNTSDLQPNVKEDTATDCVRKKRDATLECSVHEALTMEVSVSPGMSA